MPDGTVSGEVHHKDLKSLPPDGFVDIKEMPYLHVLKRRDGAARLSMEQGADGTELANNKMLIETMQEWARQFEFKNCIAEHNITDKNGTKLDFANPLTYEILNPRVGKEIEKYIDEINGESDDDKVFTPAASSSSLEESESDKPEDALDAA